MCYFITVGVAEEHADVLRQRLSDTVGASPVSNGSILRLLPAGYLTFNLGGLCSCHLYSGSGAEPLNVEKLRSKYKRKGWSEGKINRAISDKLSAREESSKGLRPDLREQLCRIAGEAGRLSIVVHFYAGGEESEIVPVEGKKVVTCHGLMSDDDSVPEDTLVEVVA
ncbi:MAG TPA: hypothetical protein VGW12_17575 [Pyrinomonadaceae bacterium]|nr:hypothetical protein [Pyrinomonadaceae bacterium]